MRICFSGLRLFQMAPLTKNKLFFTVLVILIFLFVFLPRIKNNNAVKIEHNRVVIRLPNQKNYTTLYKIIVVRADNPKELAWEYTTKYDINADKIQLPDTIVIFKNPFPFPPEKEIKNSLQNGRYLATIVVNTWGYGAPHVFEIRDVEQVIKVTFCLKRKEDGGLEICR